MHAFDNSYENCLLNGEIISGHVYTYFIKSVKQLQFCSFSVNVFWAKSKT